MLSVQILLSSPRRLGGTQHDRISAYGPRERLSKWCRIIRHETSGFFSFRGTVIAQFRVRLRG